MNYPTKETYDKASIQKDIDDRMQIINHYRTTGQLDRIKAIEKIQELRIKDKAVASVTTARLVVSSIPASQASDQAVIDELQLQIGVLTAELLQSIG